MGEEIQLGLSNDEALILFEFLSRFSDTNELRIVDQAEQRALWNLCCLLEKVLNEPFKENYGDLLMRARERVRDKDNSATPRLGGEQ